MSIGALNQQPEVLLVGAGPTGCTLALLLARRGISVALVERNGEPQQHPAACILNTRTMEVFREVGLEAQIRGACQNVGERGYITWVVSLAGRELGRCSALPEGPQGAEAFSPTQAVQFPQHKLEQMLWRGLDQAAPIGFHRRHQCLAVTQEADKVSATLLNRATGEKVVLSAPYLVACDGAASPVRRGLGIAMKGRVLQHMIGIHFFADLGRWVDQRKSVLYWVLNRNLFGVLIAHWLPVEWVLFAPYFPPQQAPEHFTSATCRELIYRALGTRQVPGLEVRHVGAWVLGAQLAERFRLGRVFLAGDAAHSFPPTGGFGLNTGVQDAHNLAWKFAAVRRGRAHPALLETYEAERRPVARANLEHSVRNFENMNELTRVVDFDLGHLGRLAAVQNSGLFRCLPGAGQRWLVDVALRLALRRVAQLDGEGPRGERLRARFRSLLPGQAPHYRSLGLDLGFAYNQGAVIADPSPKPQAEDPVTDYRPTTWPGARLPHLWVRRGVARLSLHDVVRDAGGFVLFTHPPGHDCWRHAVRAVQMEFAMPLAALSVGPAGEADLVEEQACWERLSETGPAGAVLVRPDGHIAWRCRHTPASPAGELKAVLERLGCCPQAS